MRTRKTWYVYLALLVAAGAAGVAFPGSAPAAAAGTINSGDVAWMLTATALVLLMTPGLSFFYGGMVQKRNVLSTMLQSFVCMGVLSVLWVLFGFSLAFGKDIGGVIGDPRTFAMFRGVGGAPDPALAATIPLALFAMFQLKFAIITPALITGSFAERVRFTSYLLFIVLFSIFIYCPLAHWTWHPDGFLHKWGVLDFAGGTVVHVSAGMAALAGALFIGPRKSHREKKPHVPYSIPFVALGTGMLWFGWFGFNCGSAGGANAQAVQAFVTTNTASASAMLAWLFFDAARGRKPSFLGACVAAVGGLVAITPAAGYVSVGHSLMIGVAAGIVINAAVHWKSRSTLDDTLDVFPCHGVGGMLGMICTALFAQSGGLVTGSAKLLWTHLLALVVVVTYCFGGAYLLYMITDALIPMRVTEEQEALGLDLSQHDESLEAA